VLPTDHPIVSRDQVPAGPGPLGGRSDRSRERSDAPGDLGVGHECCRVGIDVVGGEGEVEFRRVEEEEAVLRRYESERTDKLAFWKLSEQTLGSRLNRELRDIPPSR